MPNPPIPAAAGAPPQHYHIRVAGHLEWPWSAWFGGLTVTQEAEGVTRLAGPVVDQAALHGLLKQVRDLGLPLLSVNCVAPDPPAYVEESPACKPLPTPPTDQPTSSGLKRSTSRRPRTTKS